MHEGWPFLTSNNSSILPLLAALPAGMRIPIVLQSILFAMRGDSSAKEDKNCLSGHQTEAAGQGKKRAQQLQLRANTVTHAHCSTPCDPASVSLEIDLEALSTRHVPQSSFHLVHAHFHTLSNAHAVQPKLGCPPQQAAIASNVAGHPNVLSTYLPQRIIRDNLLCLRHPCSLPVSTYCSLHGFALV